MTEYVQVGSHEEAEHEDETAEGGVEVDNAKKYGHATQGVHPVQPVAVHVVVIVHHHTALGVHADRLVAPRGPLVRGCISSWSVGIDRHILLWREGPWAGRRGGRHSPLVPSQPEDNDWVFVQIQVLFIFKTV